MPCRAVLRPPRAILAAGLALVCALAPAVAGAAAPEGYTRVAKRLAPGVVHERYTGRSPDQIVNVARVAKGADVKLRAVLAHDSIAGEGARLERTSSMCARVRCLVAVNADFFNNAGNPIGALAIDDVPIRSPNRLHHQLLVTPEGALQTGAMRWTAELVPTDLRDIGIHGVNVVRQAGKLVLYTPAFGRSTRTNEHGAELVLRTPGTLRLGQTAVVEAIALREGGNTAIPARGAVLSGHGAGARIVRALWERMTTGDVSRSALLRIASEPDATQTVGGTPILVREGRRWFADEPRSFVRGRHPRTLAGWTASGELLLVTVDGRQPGRSRGMSLAEAADLMISLGAVEAINLDGGGSTTFVVNGRVANQPSDTLVRRGSGTAIVSGATGRGVVGSVERPVAVALAIVPSKPQQAPRTPPDPGAITIATETPDAARFDVASDPTSALPALVGRAHVPSDVRVPLTVVAILLLLANVGALSAFAGARARNARL